jgi:hypothetical protein
LEQHEGDEGHCDHHDHSLEQAAQNESKHGGTTEEQGC